MEPHALDIRSHEGSGFEVDRLLGGSASTLENGLTTLVEMVPSKPYVHSPYISPSIAIYLPMYSM